MKKYIFSPFITEYILSFACYILLPVILLSTRIVEIKINNNNNGNFSGVLFLAAIVFYIKYFFVRIIPGVCAIIDVITRDYVTKKMSYVTGFYANYYFVAPSGKIDLRPRKQLADSHYLRVVLADNAGKSMYVTTYIHQMESGKSYTVTYGKYSKIILSILSAKGEEMLQFDVD